MVPLLAFLIFRIIVTLEVKRLEDRARERGEPLTVKEVLANRPIVSDEENAALAVEALRRTKDAEWDWNDYDDAPIIGGTINGDLPWQGKHLAASKQFQSRFEDYFLELRDALRFPGSRIVQQNSGEDLALSDFIRRLKSDVSALIMLGWRGRTTVSNCSSTLSVYSANRSAGMACFLGAKRARYNSLSTSVRVYAEPQSPMPGLGCFALIQAVF